MERKKKWIEEIIEVMLWQASQTDISASDRKLYLSEKYVESRWTHQPIWALEILL